MAESAESLFRRGMISSKQAAKLGALKGTKHQASKMADFDGKGSVDQGGIRDRGDKIASSKHINNKRTTRAGSPIASKPSKGGQAGAEHQPGTDEINEADNQRPAFPKAGGGKRDPRRKGPIQASGPMYGGPNSR